MLTDIAIIGAPSSRAKSYLQILVKNNLFLSKFYILAHSMKKFIKEKEDYIPSTEILEGFNPAEPILYTLEKNNIPYEVIDSEDINSCLVAEKIKAIPENHLIYSGYPGQLVKSSTLGLGKKFIHVHAGVLPEYRGSTTAYYSILKERRIGASAIFLSEGIDEGAVLACESFPFPRTNIDVDYIYEPYIRAKVLMGVMAKYAQNKTFEPIIQSEINAKTYYVIHPVLKHIAILGNVKDFNHEATK